MLNTISEAAVDQHKARAVLEARHAQRVQHVAPFLTENEPVLDTGATRIEAGLGRSKPRNMGVDTQGHIVLTDRRLLIRDMYGRLGVPYEEIADWTGKPAGRFGPAKTMAYLTITLKDGDSFTLFQGRGFTEAMSNVLAAFNAISQRRRAMFPGSTPSPRSIPWVCSVAKRSSSVRSRQARSPKAWTGT